MAMRMLQSGGAAILTDGVRAADDENPHGYFEFEPVKELDQPNRDIAWLKNARGKTIKIISHLLTWLPESYDYRVLFMQRDLRELVASQQRMLAARGEVVQADDQHDTALYAQHLEAVYRFLAARSCFTTLWVPYRDVIEQPAVQARRIAEFVDTPLDVDKMVSAVDRQMYRNRREERSRLS